MLCDSFEGLSEPTEVDAETGARRDGWRASDLGPDYGFASCPGARQAID